MNCDGCTFCCKMLHVPSLGKSAGTECKHAMQGGGCELWPNHPEDCKRYLCMYRRTETVAEKFRPDMCGVVFEKIGDGIVLGTVEIALQLHKKKQAQKLSLNASKQIGYFRGLGLSVVLSAPGVKEKTIYPARGLSARDVQVRTERILEAANDSTSVQH